MTEDRFGHSIVRSILVLQCIVVDGIRMMMGTDNGSMMMRSAAG